jgi:hypothetical protein
MTFLSGFAESYTRARELRQEEQARKDEIRFKYKMDSLVDQRERRNKKKLEEEERYRQAGALAEQMGDPDSIGTFYNELSNGMSFETGQKRIAEKAYEKNPNYTKPVQKIKIPMGVSMDIPGTDGPEWKKINADIDAIDPTLRVAQDDDTSTVGDEAGNSYLLYKPKNEIKTGDFADVALKLRTAQASGDPVAIKQAEEEMQAHKDAILFKETARAEADRKEISLYGIKDEDGNLVDVIKGEVREDAEGNPQLWNVGSPLGEKLVEVPDPSMVISIDKDLNKKRYEVVRNVQKRGADLNTAQDKYVAAMQASSMLEEVVKRSPGVTKKVTGFAVIAKNLEGEAQQAVNLLEMQSAKTQEAFASNDPNVIQSAVADFENTVRDLTGENGVLSPALRNAAIDKAIYEGLLTNAVYQYAAANGISGRSMSDKDVKMFKEMISNGGEDAILQNLDNINMIVLTNLMSAEDGINNDQELSLLKDELGVSGIKGISPQRIGDKLEKINPKLRLKHDDLRKRIKSGTMNAAIGALGQSQESPEAQAQRENVREVGKLYSGAGGKQFRYKGGNPKDPKSYEEVK